MNKTKLQGAPSANVPHFACCVFALMQCLKSMADAEYLQYLVAYHAAPTLEGIKPATLICPGAKGRDIEAAVAVCAPRLKAVFGVEVACLRNHAGAFLLLVYRPGLLRAVLAVGEAEALLAESGYRIPAAGVDGLLSRLGEKCASCSFPHEIGVFLGYPPGDVRQFMQSGGKGAGKAGCWKAWDELGRAETVFARYRAAKLRAAELIVGGASLGEMAIGLRKGA